MKKIFKVFITLCAVTIVLGGLWKCIVLPVSIEIADRQAREYLEQKNVTFSPVWTIDDVEMYEISYVNDAGEYQTVYVSTNTRTFEKAPTLCVAIAETVMYCEKVI